MNEILNYFFHPEISMEVLLNDEEKRNWKNGIVKWVLIAILSGLLTVAIYKVVGVDLESLLTSYYGNMIQNLVAANINEGFIWLAIAGLSIGETLVSATIRTILWSILIYIVSKILRDSIEMNQIVKMSVFAILTWIASQVFFNAAVCFSMIFPIQTINEMLVSLGMLLSYWNLVLFIIGYSIASKATFLKGCMIVLVIQGIIWGIANAFPMLQIFLI